MIDRLGALLLIPAVWSLGVSIWFAIKLSNGFSWTGIDETIRFWEVWLYGVPLMVATVGGVLMAWASRRQRATLSWLDLVLSICGIAAMPNRRRGEYAQYSATQRLYARACASAKSWSSRLEMPRNCVG